MAATGSEPEDFAPDFAAEVWPENWPSWRLWGDMSSQVRVGFAGAYALDYTPLFHRMDRLSLDDAQWNEMFNDIRLIESIAFAPKDSSGPIDEAD